MLLPFLLFEYCFVFPAQDLLPDKIGTTQLRFKGQLESIIKRIRAGEFPPAKVVPPVLQPLRDYPNGQGKLQLHSMCRLNTICIHRT